MLDFVDTLYMTWRLPPLAAAFNSETASFPEKIKRNSGFDYFKTAMYKFFKKKSIENYLPNSGFFLPLGRYWYI